MASFIMNTYSYNLYGIYNMLLHEHDMWLWRMVAIFKSNIAYIYIYHSNVILNGWRRAAILNSKIAVVYQSLQFHIQWFAGP